MIVWSPEADLPVNLLEDAEDVDAQMRAADEEYGDVTRYTIMVACPVGVTWEELLTVERPDEFKLNVKHQGKPFHESVHPTIAKASRRIAQVIPLIAATAVNRELAGREIARIIYIPEKLFNIIPR